MAIPQKPSKRAATDREVRTARALAALRQIVGKAKRQFASSHEKSDLSGAQLWALSQVKNAPGLTMQELAAVMAVHQSTASNLVEKLESAGYVRKKREVLDRRVVRLYTTASGTQLLKKAPSPVRDVLPEAVKQLTDEELKALEKSLLLLAGKIPTEHEGTRRTISDPLV
jgi:DNA-binding MarR family transcriptional regulator